MDPTLLPFLAGLAVTFFFLWLARRRDPIDEAAGVQIGQSDGRAALRAASPAWPTKHFISACMYCHHVTRSDAHPVRVGDELRVSHGICPACMAKKHPEVVHAELAAA